MGSKEARGKPVEGFRVSRGLKNPGRFVLFICKHVIFGEDAQHVFRGLLGGRYKRDILTDRQLNDAGEQRIMGTSKDERVYPRGLQRL